VANVDQEMFSVYENNKNETFRDTARTHSVAQATRLLSGWGLKFFDYDNDGEIDLILANGHPDDMIENYSQQVKYQEPLLLFHQEGRKLKNVSAQAGPASQNLIPPVDWPSATSLTTASWMFWWRTAERRRYCCATTRVRAITGWGSASGREVQPRWNRGAGSLGPWEEPRARG